MSRPVGMWGTGSTGGDEGRDDMGQAAADVVDVSCCTNSSRATTEVDLTGGTRMAPVWRHCKGFVAQACVELAP
ncbi:hypothetical protein GCM10010329_32850 [Streptomyces spiroverticillatus]|uniref:Uncharacterized protein n=1 Tax=Streptomyces finlayi TaxID=67296 RepID=A0A919C9J9_9ACTN|nr:hypothetical protein GCM10010329_32850 [Streptomyces spiroverticillatus]GHC90872.1 hypothetical protein GCM10010334_25260 [Streptomyces finlayi]